MSLARCVVSALLLLTALGGARAQSQEPRRYAVISTLGNALSVVEIGMPTAAWPAASCSMGNCSNVDRVQLRDDSLDRIALQAARRALLATDPSARVELLAVTEEELPPPHRVLRESRFAPPAELAAVLSQDHITHVIVIEAHPDEAAFIKKGNKYLAQGRVEGVGFYVDRVSRVHADSSFGPAFFAPFASLDVVLAQVADGVVLNSTPVRSSKVVSSAEADGAADPWDAVEDARKAQMLDRVLEKGVAEAVPVLLRSH